MSVLYNPRKENVVADALRLMSMGSIAHVEDDKKELVCDVHRLSKLGTQLVYSPKGGSMVQRSSVFFLVVDVKDRKHLDPILIELNHSVLGKPIKAFSQGVMGHLSIKIGCMFWMWIT